MGRLSTETALGNIVQDQTYDSAGVVSAKSVPYISGQTAYRATYSTGGVYQQSVSYPDGRSMNYYKGPDSVNVQRNDGAQRTAYYQEDGKVREVLEQDPATGTLNVETDYYYDTLGRLTSISQGVQTRTYTYDDLGRTLTETLPESGTTSYTYDLNSNVLSKTDSRGIVTGYTYDELNRITYKSYSDGTPAVSYYYDSQPADSPITISNPIGRLTKVTTTVSGVSATNFYSYCNCSSVKQEAAVINDGTARTYITSYAHNWAGQLTSITYPNGKVVNYTRDSQGRETQASGTYNGQAFNYISGAQYQGPQGGLTKISYPISLSPRSYVQYAYNPANLFLTTMQTPDGNWQFNYLNTSSQATSLIQDITNNDSPTASEHFAYDKWDRLTSYWISNQRTDTPSRKLDLTYDRYGNIATVAETISGVINSYAFTVDAMTNRLLSRTKTGGTATFSYDLAGNMTNKGSFDAENRLTSNGGISYLYDGNGRRFRKQISGPATIKVNYIYSHSGQLLVEDNLTASTTDNHIYFAGKALAIQGQQDGTFKLLYKDRLGSTRRSYIVSLPSYTATLCEQYQYDAWGQIISSGQYNSPYTDFKYQGKERENNLDYFGARYFDSASISGGSPMRWISPDPVTSNVYDPQSLNKYTYVRNDPVNNTDPDGRWVFDAVSEMQYSLMASLPFVNGVSGAQNPFDSYYFQYMMYQAQFNAYQYQMYLAQQSVQQYQMSVSAQAGVSSYNETVTMQNTANGIDRAKAALAIPSCAAIFGFDSFSGTGVADPSSVLNNLLNGGSSLFIIAYDPIPLMQNINGTTGYTANASTQMIGTSQSMATGATNNIALITINTDMTTPFNNMDVNYQAATILHELAHAFNIVYGAGTSKIFNDDQTVPNNTSVSRGNQDYIQSQCGL